MIRSTRLRTTVVIFILCACGPVRFSTKDELSSSPGGTPVTPSDITRPVNFTTVVAPPNNKLDILLVIDNSNSMLADNQKLASRLSTFVNTFQNSAIDWQMCVTTTSTLTYEGSQVWGASVFWANHNSWVLKAGTSNLTNIFKDTIDSIGAGWKDTDDERGLKAAWWHLYNGDPRYDGNSGCYRQSAALAVVLISDEDERSVGGFATDEYYQGEFKALENEDLPATLAGQVQDIFGTGKQFSFNSIIVKPDDSSCMNQQDSEGSKSHYGRKYSEMSGLTGGGVGSICDSDYYANLSYFKNEIQTTLASFPLECQPSGGIVDFKINGSSTTSYTMRIDGMSAVFTPALPSGVRLDLSYSCPL